MLACCCLHLAPSCAKCCHKEKSCLIQNGLKILKLKINWLQSWPFFCSVGQTEHGFGSVCWENLEELWVFSNDCSGALSEELRAWVWCLSHQTQCQTPPNSNAGKSSSAFSGIQSETLYCSAEHWDHVSSPQVPTQMDIKEKRAACSSCDNTSFCMRVCVHALYSMPMSTRLHCMSLHLCVSVFLWGHEQGCSPPQTSPFPLLCCLMIKAPAVPPLLLMLWHNRACWGFDFFIHSSP